MRVIGSRVLGLFITLLLSSMVVFGALLIAPGSPLTFLTQGRSTSPEAIAALEKQYHLDESIPAQYWHWLSGVVQGDFGNSILYKDSVASLVAERAMNTVVLVACAAVLIIVVGLVLGVITGLRPGRLSSLAMVVATGAMAVPAFVAAVVLTLVFAVQLGWLPAFGPGDGFRGRIEHMILPAVALALSSVAFVARLTQTAVREELTSEHVQTATSRGLPRRTVIGRHVLRNAAIPILTVAGLTVAGLIAASVIVEQAFQLNGLGSFLVTAVQQKDFPVVQAICLLYVAAFIVLNTLIDVAYSLLDPRIAMNGGRP
ncbi:ABC transporter permease [Nocardioides eburneiflavus]|uniref:ABC transporter permease n=1 Tax=Nocardioides eburneiflavus TaxID=2518372 RepID=A0A4Z1CPT0_9ACTN|nr:ABC transporter permease [Nocardioides eburneiflavus]